MIGRTCKVGAAGLLLALTLGAGSGAAAAQTASGKGTRPAHAAPIKGTITSVGNGSLQIQTASGPVTVTYTATTRVKAIKTGTTADLTPNARVELHLVQGTTTADAVQVMGAEPAGAKPATTKPVTTKPAGTKHAKTGSSTTPTQHTSTGPRSHAGGAIVSFNVATNTLTLSRGHGQTTTATYTLASNVKITKVVAGTTADLSKGETVEVFAPSNNAAVAITILG